jgi:hypothetical protein
MSQQADVVEDNQSTKPPTQWPPPPAEEMLVIRQGAARKRLLRWAVVLLAIGAAITGFAGHAVLAGSLAAVAAVGALADVLSDG